MSRIARRQGISTTVPMLAVFAVLTRGTPRSRAESYDDVSDHCRVCDHPFGDLKHACL